MASLTLMVSPGFSCIYTHHVRAFMMDSYGRPCGDNGTKTASPCKMSLVMAFVAMPVGEINQKSSQFQDGESWDFGWNLERETVLQAIKIEASKHQCKVPGIFAITVENSFNEWDLHVAC